MTHLKRISCVERRMALAGEKILVVDDEATVRKIISHFLTQNGFQVLTAEDGYSAFKLVQRQKPDLILLDIILPGLDGIEVCQVLRRLTDSPIIFLTSKNTDLVLGLGVGGDDYITKPFDPDEMIARVKAHLRRNRLLMFASKTGKQDELLKFPGLEIDLSGRSVWANGSLITLPVKEFELLVLFAQNPNRVFPIDQLYELIWKLPDINDNRTVFVHINRLRKKIEKDPSNPVYILTVRGVGYKFNGFINDF